VPIVRKGIAVLVLVAACGGSGRRATPALEAQAPAGWQDTTPIPPGFGTLRRDDIVVQFNASQLQIQVLPLEEDIIRLLLPDAYEALSSLVQSKRDAITTAAQRGGVMHPALVLVTFRGVVPQARFSPDELTIGSRGQLFRPVGVVPLSTAWDTYQLEVRQQAMAIYLFPEGISFRERLLVGYQGLVNDSWSRTLSAVDRERSAVLVRARAARPDSAPPDSTPR
jgi:hypothetical protein